MRNRGCNHAGRVRLHTFLGAAIAFLLVAAVPRTNAQAPNAAGQAKVAPALGTIKSISASSLVLATDSGGEVHVQLPADVKVVRVPPGSKDLKEATPIEIRDLQIGDRVLVQMRPGEDANSPVAFRVVAMKKADIAEKQAKEREEWQRHGIGGLVKSVDAGAGTIIIGTLSATGPKDVIVHATSATILRRYAPGSVKFDEAKPAPIGEIHAGDQLRARGSRGTDSADFTADEIVSGSFRNIGGTVTAVDANAGTLTVNDIATKKQIDLKVTSDSQLRKLPPVVAQRIAARLKGEPSATAASAPGQTPAGAAPASGAAGSANPNSGPGVPSGGSGRTGGGDMQQMLSRLPASPLGEFQKGDAVMIVATSGQPGAPATVITLLGGAEPILQSSAQAQAASILSPWSLNQGGGGDAGTP